MVCGLLHPTQAVDGDGAESHPPASYSYRPALLVQPLLTLAAARAQRWGPCTNPFLPSSSCGCHGYRPAWSFRLDRHLQWQGNGGELGGEAPSSPEELKGAGGVYSPQKPTRGIMTQNIAALIHHYLELCTAIHSCIKWPCIFRISAHRGKGYLLNLLQHAMQWSHGFSA